jgi:hypothetical protein
MQPSSAIAPLMLRLLNLPAAQKLELIEQLWASLMPSDLDQTVPSWKLETIDKSKAQYELAPESAESWDALRKATQASHRQS